MVDTKCIACACRSQIDIKSKGERQICNHKRSIAACRALCVFPSIHHTQSCLKTVLPTHVVIVLACSARDAGVDALRMEALAPSAKRSRTGEAAAQPAGQAERPAAKYAPVKPLKLLAICVYMHRTAAWALCGHKGAGRAGGGGGWG